MQSFQDYLAGSGDPNFLRYLQGVRADFQPYAAGRKVYGMGRPGPNRKGTRLPKLGYARRDRKAKAKRDAMLRKLKAQQKNRYMSADYLNPYGGM